MYTFVFVAAHIFSCIWYYIASISNEDNNWLLRYRYIDENLDDRYMASLYYIYSTLTTTGYGDIVPGTNYEIALTIIFVACGVSFHSYIYTTMLDKFDKYGDKHEFYNTKKYLLHSLATTTNLFKGNKGRMILREIIVVINEHKQHESD